MPGTCMCSLDCQQDLALLSLPTVAWTLTSHVHDLLNDVYAVLATIVCVCPHASKQVCGRVGVPLLPTALPKERV